MIGFLRTIEEEKLIWKTRKWVSIALKTATLIIIYLLYSPLLIAIHPSINGIGIIMAMLGIFFIVLKTTKNRRIAKETCLEEKGKKS